MFLKLKKEFKRTKSRKYKKKFFQKIFINQVKANNLTVKFLFYFIKSQKIFIDRRNLRNILIMENGCLFSLRN